MSERKVLNKYYPPDFDPSKIPRMKLPRNRQYTVRLMAPFNMRCATCGEYIYKGKKFNARKEDVENEDYLGIRIYRFYIKCTRCLQEISFKTDPKNTDYEIEAGATRNFMALKLAEEQAQREEDELKEEEANNPMKLLENRTEQSRNEIELLESLEELKDLNRRHQNIDYDTILQQYDTSESVREREERLERLDEEYIRTVKFNTGSKRRIVVEEEIIDDQPSPAKKTTEESETTTSQPSSTTNILATKSETATAVIENKLIKPKWEKSVGVMSKKSNLYAGLVKLKNGTSAPKELSKNCSEEPSSTGNTSKPTSLSLLGNYSSSDNDSS